MTYEKFMVWFSELRLTGGINGNELLVVRSSPVTSTLAWHVYFPRYMAENARGISLREPDELGPSMSYISFFDHNEAYYLVTKLAAAYLLEIRRW